MQKPVDDICQLLEDDIGTPEGGGLRNQLKNDYDSLIAEQRTYIYANEAKMTPDEKRTEIENLPQLVTTEQQDDATLAQTQAALKALAATNEALATTKNSKQSPAFRALLADLVAEGQQIGSVYKATMSK
jgi:spore coat protein CotF